MTTVTASQPKSPAERQAAYRARRRSEYGFRVSLFLPETAGRQLQRLARHEGLTQAELLAKLLADADAAVLDTLDDHGIAGYFGAAG